MKKENILKNAVIFLSIIVGIILLYLLLQLLYSEHIKKRIQVVNTPEEFLSEEMLEWEEKAVGLIADTDCWLLGRTCFSYRNNDTEVYYIPTARFFYQHVKQNAYWQCTIDWKKVTRKNGIIQKNKNSYLDRNKIKTEITMDSGGGAEFVSSTSQIPGK